jgi:hypothetical protein
MKYFEEKEKEFVYLHAQNGICFGKVRRVPGFYRSGIFFGKKTVQGLRDLEKGLIFAPALGRKGRLEANGKVH